MRNTKMENKKVKDELDNLPCEELKFQMKRIRESVKTLPLHGMMIRMNLPLQLMGPIKMIMLGVAEQEFVNGAHFGSRKQIEDNEYNANLSKYFENVMKTEEENGQESEQGC